MVPPPGIPERVRSCQDLIKAQSRSRRPRAGARRAAAALKGPEPSVPPPKSSHRGSLPGAAGLGGGELGGQRNSVESFLLQEKMGRVQPSCLFFNYLLFLIINIFFP